MEDHHVREVVVFVWEHIDWRELTTILIHPGNLTTLGKDRMVLKENKKTWDYYEYPENC